MLETSSFILNALRCICFLRNTSTILCFSVEDPTKCLRSSSDQKVCTYKIGILQSMKRYSHPFIMYGPWPFFCVYTLIVCVTLLCAGVAIQECSKSIFSLQQEDFLSLLCKNQHLLKRQRMEQQHEFPGQLCLGNISTLTNVSWAREHWHFSGALKPALGKDTVEPQSLGW